MEKKFNTQIAGKFLYIEFHGDIDDTVCPKYKTLISELIEQNRTKDVVFNFKNVTFIDSSGIGLILGRYNQLKSHRKRLYVTQTNTHIQKLFKISGIYTIIKEFNLAKVGESSE